MATIETHTFRNDFAVKRVAIKRRKKSDLFRAANYASKIKILRVCVDWQTVYYKCTVDPNVYPDIAFGLRLDIRGFVFELEARRTGTHTILQTDGLYIVVKDPLAFEPWRESVRDGAGPQQYPVEVQFQGRFFAAGLGEHIDIALSGIESSLGIRRWIVPYGFREEQREGLTVVTEQRLRGSWVSTPIEATDRIPARIDLAGDVWLPDTDGLLGEEAYRVLVGNGSMDVSLDYYLTRAKKQMLTCDQSSEHEIKSTAPAVRYARDNADNITLYLGSDVQLCVYRKDADFANNSKDLLVDEWTDAGWNGTGVVARVEFRISRESIRVRDFIVDGVIVRGRDIDLEGLHACLGELWHKCLSSFRHCPPYPGAPERRKRRDESPVWQELRRHAPKTFTRQTTADIVYAPKEYDVNNLLERAKRTMISVGEACGRNKIHEVADFATSERLDAVSLRERSPWRGFRFKRSNADEYRKEDDERARALAETATGRGVRYELEDRKILEFWQPRHNVRFSRDE